MESRNRYMIGRWISSYICNYLIWNQGGEVKYCGEEGLYNMWCHVTIISILKEINVHPYLT